MNNGLIHKFIPDPIVEVNDLAFLLIPPQSDFMFDVERFDKASKREDDTSLIHEACVIGDILNVPILRLDGHRGEIRNSQLRQLIGNKHILFVPLVKIDYDTIRILEDLSHLASHENISLIIGADENSFLETEKNQRLDNVIASIKPLWKEVVPILSFLDALLWDKVRFAFRSEWMFINGSILADTLLPSLRDLGLGEPQLLKYFHRNEGENAVLEYGLEIDVKPTEKTRMRLVFRRPVKMKEVEFEQYNYPFLRLKVSARYDIACDFVNYGEGESYFRIGLIEKQKITDLRPLSELKMPDECKDGYIRQAIKRTVDEISWLEFQWASLPSGLGGLHSIYSFDISKIGKLLYKNAKCFMECNEPVVTYCAGYKRPCNRFACGKHTKDWHDVGEGFFYQRIEICPDCYARAAADFSLNLQNQAMKYVYNDYLQSATRFIHARKPIWKKILTFDFQGLHDIQREQSEINQIAKKKPGFEEFFNQWVSKNQQSDFFSAISYLFEVDGNAFHLVEEKMKNPQNRETNLQSVSKLINDQSWSSKRFLSQRTG